MSSNVDVGVFQCSQVTLHRLLHSVEFEGVILGSRLNSDIGGNYTLACEQFLLSKREKTLQLRSLSIRIYFKILCISPYSTELLGLCEQTMHNTTLYTML